MQLVKISLILSIISPLLVHAGPIAADDALIKRDKDICPRDRTAQEGDPCNKRSGDKAPHICAKNRPRVIMNCVNNKWKFERKCPAATKCGCTSSDEIYCARVLIGPPKE